MSYLSQAEIQKLNFKKVGKNVHISSKCSIYNPGNISIGNDVRIDDFSVLSAGEGGIIIENNVHIACFCSLIGESKITLESFSGLSSRVSIYSSSDDYTGNFLTNPTVSAKYKNVDSREVVLRKHVIIGSNSVILPGVIIGINTAIGAMSLVSKKCEENSIYSGVPARKIKSRKTRTLELEVHYLKEFFL